MILDSVFAPDVNCIAQHVRRHLAPDEAVKIRIVALYLLVRRKGPFQHDVGELLEYLKRNHPIVVHLERVAQQIERNRPFARILIACGIDKNIRVKEPHLSHSINRSAASARLYLYPGSISIEFAIAKE